MDGRTDGQTDGRGGGLQYLPSRALDVGGGGGTTMDMSGMQMNRVAPKKKHFRAIHWAFFYLFYLFIKFCFVKAKHIKFKN